jgi:hypothetical protein
LVGDPHCGESTAVSHFNRSIYANLGHLQLAHAQIGLDTKCDLEEKWHVGCDISSRPNDGHKKVREKRSFFSALAGTKNHKEVEAEKKIRPFGIGN